jgi:excisionase family DNA binding protein
MTLQTNAPAKEFLTVKETAQKLRIAEGTLYNKVYQGELDFIKLFGKILFKADYIDQLISKNSYQSKETQRIEKGL